MKRLLSYVAVVMVTIILTTIFQPLSHLPTFAQGGCRSFTETGKSVCGRFLQYWQANGGLAQQGLPLSGEFTEVSDLNGKPYTVQYFERAVFEAHPENQPPFDVLLSQLGTFQFKRKYPNGDPSGLPAPTPTSAPPPAAPTPLPSIQGQTIEFAGFLQGRFRATVTEVQEAKDIPPSGGGRGGTARGKFVLVRAVVTNIGSVSASTGRSTLKLRDSTGRIFDITDNFDAWYSAVKACGCPTYNDNIQPGLPTPMVFVFDVATDANSYYLVAGN